MCYTGPWNNDAPRRHTLYGVVDMQFFKRYAFVYLLILVLVWALSGIASESVTLVSTAFAPVSEPPVTVVIDPGHGGEDGGAVSCTGVTESGLNLAIGQKLSDILLFLGVRTVLTRETDVSLHSADAQTVSEKKISDLKNRVKLVNGTENAVLVSIHQNTFSEEKYSGAQVFYAPTHGSMELAEIVQGSLRAWLDPENRREIKESLSVYLMRKIACPGILVECGFLSNQKEEEKLRQNGYQTQLACVIACGLREYLAQTADAQGGEREGYQ